MELRVQDKRAVLVRTGAATTDGQRAEHVGTTETSLDAELTSALQEWARVATVVGTGRAAHDARVAAMVSRRGKQLAGRVAESTGLPVYYQDPVRRNSVVVRPPARRGAVSTAESLLGVSYEPGEPTPWLSGFTLALFCAACCAVTMLALVNALAAEVGGWLGLLIVALATAGLAPSAWLGRRKPILRWLSLGGCTGMLVAWIGALAALS